MSGFSTDTLKVATGDGRSFVLLESFTYTAKSGEVITVPAGTASDGASTPRILWRLIPPFGPYWKPAFLHDYLYRNTARLKAECDLLLLEAMISCGVGQIEAEVIYQGVRDGGQPSFDEDRAIAS